MEEEDKEEMPKLEPIQPTPDTSQSASFVVPYIKRQTPSENYTMPQLVSAQNFRSPSLNHTMPRIASAPNFPSPSLHSAQREHPSVGNRVSQLQRKIQMLQIETDKRGFSKLNLHQLDSGSDTPTSFEFASPQYVSPLQQAHP